MIGDARSRSPLFNRNHKFVQKIKFSISFKNKYKSNAFFLSIIFLLDDQRFHQLLHQQRPHMTLYGYPCTLVQTSMTYFQHSSYKLSKN
jgi:hypothetical protein